MRIIKTSMLRQYWERHREAEAEGMTAHFLPVVSGQLTLEDVTSMERGGSWPIPSVSPCPGAAAVVRSPVMSPLPARRTGS